MGVEKWLAYSLASLILWGAWGILVKYVSETLNWRQLYFYSGLATITLVLLIALTASHDVLSVGPRNAVLAVLAGVFGATGYVAMIKALEAGGKASIVVPLTSLYPAVTVILAWLLLGERITPSKATGIILALIAIYLFSRP